MSKLLSIADAKSLVKSVHGNSFELPDFETEYKTNMSMVTIVCPIHGEAIVKFYGLTYSKTGCPKCSSLRAIISRKHDREYGLQEMVRFYTYIKSLSSKPLMPVFETIIHNAELHKLYVKYLDSIKSDNVHPLDLKVPATQEVGVNVDDEVSPINQSVNTSMQNMYKSVIEAFIMNINAINLGTVSDFVFTNTGVSNSIKMTTSDNKIINLSIVASDKAITRTRSRMAVTPDSSPLEKVVVDCFNQYLDKAILTCELTTEYVESNINNFIARIPDIMTFINHNCGGEINVDMIKQSVVTVVNSIYNKNFFFGFSF